MIEYNKFNKDDTVYNKSVELFMDYTRFINEPYNVIKICPESNPKSINVTEQEISDIKDFIRNNNDSVILIDLRNLLNKQVISFLDDTKLSSKTKLIHTFIPLSKYGVQMEDMYTFIVTNGRYKECIKRINLMSGLKEIYDNKLDSDEYNDTLAQFAIINIIGDAREYVRNS